VDSSIQQVARSAGTTSRTLRHYDALGLLRPSRTDAGGRRWYDTDALVRLQRILLLRDLGLPLEQIGRVLDAQVDEIAALHEHLDRLRAERRRLDRQTAAVERTIAARTEGAPMDPQDMFDGFDHTRYETEVTERWGRQAYATSDSWWRGLGPDEREQWQARSATLVADWRAAAQAGIEPGSPTAQALAERHAAWLGAVPGTPGDGSRTTVDHVLALGEMYVADPRFAATYGGEHGARFVRDTLRIWARD
jgi:DNA-binding transcriptional MerR regulator